MSERDFDRRGWRRPIRIVLAWSIVPAILLIGFFAWPFLDPARFAPGPHATKSTSGAAGSDQRAGESRAAKDTMGPEDPSGGRARDIQHTAEPLTLTPDQQGRLRALIGPENPPRADQIPFSLEIGAAIPSNVELRDLPPEASRILNGYQGDQYVVVRDKLVIVDRPSRRIAAIVPNVA